MLRYATISFWILLIGIFMVVLSAFGIEPGTFDLFKGGVAVCFAAFLAWETRA